MKTNLVSTLEKTAKVISGRAGKDVQIISRGNEHPRTDGRRIWLPELPDPCPEEIQRVFHGVTDHELGHIKFSNFSPITAFKRKWGEQGFAVLNSLEDLRCDELMGRTYPGSKENLARCYEHTLEDWKKVADKMPLWGRLIGCLIATGKGWETEMYGEDANVLVDEVRDILLKAPRATSTRAVAVLAEQILEQWKELLEEKETDDEQENAESEDQDEGEDGEKDESPKSGGSDGKDGKDDKDANADSGDKGGDSGSESDDEGEEEKQADQAEDGDGAESEAQDAPAAQAEPGPDPGLIQAARNLFSSQPLGDEPNPAKHLTKVLADYSSTIGVKPYRVFTREYDQVVTAPEGTPYGLYRLLSDVKPLVSGLRQKLLAILKSKSQCRLVADENGTRLDRRRLHSLLLDVPTAPFAKKSEAISDKVAISLLIDQSGSMDGRKMQLATQCAALMGDTLSQLGMEFEVLGFTTTADLEMRGKILRRIGQDFLSLEKVFARFDPLQHSVFKAFHEPYRRCRGRLAGMKTGNLTPINESLLWAAQRILGHKGADRRILIVLTDGIPATGTHSLQASVEAHLDHVISQVRGAGVEVVAVGIMTDYVKRHFDRSIVVNELQELPKEFYTLLAGLLLGRKRRAA